MPTSDGKALVERGHGNRSRVLEPDVQSGQGSSAEIDWERGFLTLSSLLGRQMLSGDVLKLICMGLIHHEGPELARVFAEAVAGNRDPRINDFMG